VSTIGKKVVVQFRVFAEIVIGKFPFLVADISDDCILGVNFIRRVNLIKILEPKFGNEIF